MDALADVLDLSRAQGALMANVRAGAPWGLELPKSTGAACHAVTAGTAWLRVGGGDPLQLMPGDVVLLPAGTSHRLSSGPTGRCVPYDRTVKEQRMSPDGTLEIGGPGAVTSFVCARLRVRPRRRRAASASCRQSSTCALTQWAGATWRHSWTCSRSKSAPAGRGNGRGPRA